jgi:hypothetical protein
MNKITRALAFVGIAGAVAMAGQLAQAAADGSAKNTKTSVLHHSGKNHRVQLTSAADGGGGGSCGGGGP